MAVACSLPAKVKPQPKARGKKLEYCSILNDRAQLITLEAELDMENFSLRYGEMLVWDIRAKPRKVPC